MFQRFRIIILACLMLSFPAVTHADTITVKSDEWCPFNCEPGSDTPGYIIDVAKIIFKKAGHEPIPVREVTLGRVLVVGEVAQPRALPYVEGMTFLDAYLGAGGGTVSADLKGVKIARQPSEGEKTEIQVDVDDLLKRGEVRQNVVRSPGDIVIVSIHWGGNWGYKIPAEQQEFSHRLVDEAGVDIVHGHSSHHVKAIEVYQERLILYGCGDFFNDYEGIGGHQEFRGDLALMYFVDIDPASGKLLGLTMVPTQVRRFRVTRASQADSKWVEALLNREGKPFHTRVSKSVDDTLSLHWA